MRTAIDTSALLSIFNAEPEAKKWLDLLVRARREGQLIICDVVYSELAPAFENEPAIQTALGKMGISFEPTSPAAAWRAGMSFRAYRDAGGPRKSLIPDFLIAAHAKTHADGLAAVDRGYLRSYFSDLLLLAP